MIMPWLASLSLRRKSKMGYTYSSTRVLASTSSHCAILQARPSQQVWSKYANLVFLDSVGYLSQLYLRVAWTLQSPTFISSNSMMYTTFITISQILIVGILHSQSQILLMCHVFIGHEHVEYKL
jgi:hypothetical protein